MADRASVESIVGEIRAGIASGRLAPGRRLPAATDLAEALGAQVWMAEEALTLLREEGILTTRAGGGTWVLRAPRP